MNQDPTRRFSVRVDAYERYRPSYPAAVAALAERECGLRAGQAVADIGCGTGLLARLFLERGCHVFGVEPNPEMRDAGRRALAESAQFQAIDGRAESTTLATSSVDFVTAGQAAHWFDADPARAEFARILKPEGWCVLIWNERRTATTPFLRDYEQLLLTYGTDYKEVRHERTTATIHEFFAPSLYQERVFSLCQRFDYEGAAGRLLSSSYAPLEGHPSHAPMMRGLQRIFRAHAVDGTVEFEYDTRVFCGKLE